MKVFFGFKRFYSEKLYEGHRSTNLFQKLLFGIGSGLTAVTNPARGGFGDVTAYYALKKLQRIMLMDPVGRRILREKPTINSSVLNLEKLIKYPKNTLGYVYSEFMIRNKISSDTREPVHYLDDPDLAYVLKRYRETHDFNHVLSGVPDVRLMSEVIVKTFEAVQTGLPGCALATMASLKLKPEQRKRYLNTYVPWAIYAGTRAKLLLCTYFEEEMETPYDKLLKKLDLIQAPELYPKKKGQ